MERSVMLRWNSIYLLIYSLYQVEIIRKELFIRKESNEDVQSKELLSNEAVQREKHILSLLRCQRHPNIIRLLASYTIKNSFNLLFPRAEGDLKTLLSSVNRPVGFEADEKVLHALFDLSSSIYTFHSYVSDEFKLEMIGCHYDLKPKNILFQQGTLLLS